MCDQVEIRKLFEKHVEENGVKCKHIAAQVGCSPSTISHWRRGRKLQSRFYYKLVNYLGFTKL